MQLHHNANMMQHHKRLHFAVGLRRISANYRQRKPVSNYPLLTELFNNIYRRKPWKPYRILRNDTHSGKNMISFVSTAAGFDLLHNNFCKCYVAFWHEMCKQTDQNEEIVKRPLNGEFRWKQLWNWMAQSDFRWIGSNSNILSRPNGKQNAHHRIYHTVHRAFNISPQNIIETATQRSQREQQRPKKQQHTGRVKIDRSTVIHSKNARKQKLH